MMVQMCSMCPDRIGIVIRTVVLLAIVNVSMD